jgi:hypothetical protein
MPSTSYDVAFVDSITASPTVRLDLHTSGAGWQCLGDGTQFPPPPLDRIVTQSQLTDGDLVPSAAYRNRTITLALELSMGLDADAAATRMQLLMRELDRTGNFLRYRTDTTTPVYFRTFRSGPEAVAWDPIMRRATVTLLAEPFAYGLRETLSPVTVTNNPAAASNGMFLDIASPKGDVETPLTVSFSNGSVGLGATGRLRSALAMRRRGTVANVPFFLQAEAMTMSIADTTVQANSASMSGAGSNFVKVAFTTSTAMVNRIQTTTRFPSSASVDARGAYRVFARVRQNTVADVFDMRLLYGSTAVQITGDTVRLPADTGPSAPTIKYVDLSGGTPMQIPLGYDPVTDGLSGVELAAEGNFLVIQAQRVSGSGTLDIDVLLFVPADDRLELIKWPEVQNFSTDTFVAEGGPRPAAYCLNTNGQVSAVEAIEISGGGMMVTPGRTNRLFFFRDVGTGTASTGSGDSVTATNILTCSYYPRYLSPVRPVAS